jgi:YVTN family beta-propeller protein
VPVGAHPFGLALDASGARAYTADVESNTVSVVDVAAHRLAGTIKVGKRPYVVALDSAHGFVTNELASTVTVFDVQSLQTLATIPVGDYPEGMQASADGKFLYVANWDSNTLSIIDAQTLKAVGSLNAGTSPRAFGTFLR